MLAVNFPQHIFKAALFPKLVEEYLVSLTNPMYMFWYTILIKVIL